MTLVVAHGIGAHGDLPLPLWLAVYAAAFTLLIAFAAVHLLRPATGVVPAGEGAPLPSWARRAARSAPFWGWPAWPSWCSRSWLRSSASPTPRPTSPRTSSTSHSGPACRSSPPHSGMSGRRSTRSTRWPGCSASPIDRMARAPGGWTAAPMLFTFVWLELAYFEPSDPRVIGLWLGLYTIAAMVGAGLWGRGWLRSGEGFSVFFGLLARLSPFYRLRVRWPLSGLDGTPVRRGIAAVLLVVLGATLFDGVTGAQPWLDLQFREGLSGWRLTAVNTLGLVVMISAVAAVAWLAMALVARRSGRSLADIVAAFAPTLIPVVIAFSVAHYVTLLVFESQNLLALASDPFGRGWDVLGTGGLRPDYGSLSPTLVAWIQATAVVIGPVLAVIVAHDRAVVMFPAHKAMSYQLPLLGLFVIYAIGGLALLLGA